MRILFATSECAPFIKRGGLGDVSRSLPTALSKIGLEVTVILPYFDCIPKKFKTVCVGQLAVDYRTHRELVYVYETHIPETKVDVLLLKHNRLKNYEDEAFPFYCASTVSWVTKCALEGNPYDIVHCNDWHTGLIPPLLGENRKTDKKRTVTMQSQIEKTVITIHNLMYHGITPTSVVLDTGIPRSMIREIPTTKGSVVNCFREGLEYADVITTVSPSYAREIVSPAFGPQIYDVMRRRHDRIKGILNGIDSTVWNPATDPYLVKTYSKSTVRTGKQENKKHLQKAFGLPVTDDLLFGFIGRIEPNQKGVALVMKAIARMTRKNYQVVFLGIGNKEQMRDLVQFDKLHEQVGYVQAFDERLARRMYAGCDVILVPSKFEPCGLIQMIAMRYGAIPLVRKTGGLADSVTDGVTGFVFSHYDVDDISKVMWKAITTREDHPDVWNRMIARIMRKDFSWVKSAKQYVALYDHLLNAS